MQCERHYHYPDHQYRVSNATVSVANVENAHHSTRWGCLCDDDDDGDDDDVSDYDDDDDDDVTSKRLSFT